MKKNYLFLLMFLLFAGSIQAQTPTFTQVAPICSGDVLAPLPLLSNNNVSGTWAPAVVNTATTTYTFTPTNPFLATTTTMTIVVNPKPILTFGADPFPICAGTSSILSADSNNTPPSLSYGSQTVKMLPAFFGTFLTSPLTGTLVNSPNNGCGAVSPYTTGQFTGKIVLIQRGACNFSEKALNAQNAGAIGVIIYNSPTGAGTDGPEGAPLAGGIFTPGGASALVTIPVYGISNTDGLAVIAALVAGQLPLTLYPLTYLWSTGATTQKINSGVLNINTPFTVTVTVTATGCFTTSSVSANVIPAPVITGNTTQNFLETATISSIVVTPTTVAWYASSSNALSGTAPLLGTQTLVNNATYYAVSTVGTCKSAPYAVTVGTTLGATGFDANTLLNVSPNPFSDVLNISIDSKATIEIIDMVGKSIQNLTVENGISRIDLSNVASGVYMMKVVNEKNQSKTVRIIKN